MSNKSSSNKVREGVESVIEKNALQSSYSYFQKEPLKIIAATADVYRQEKSNDGYTASDDHKKIFEEARKNLANIKGIKPNEKGEFDKEHLDKDLSPLEIMRTASLYFYSKEKNNETSFEKLNQTFSEIYKEDDDIASVPDEISAINNSLKTRTFLTDDDFLARSEGEQMEYISGLKEYGAEKSRLIDMLKEREKNGQKKRNAAHIKKSNDDLGAIPHSGKNTDFKSKPGDIIEFMQTEIIGAFGDWVLNRTEDVLTYLTIGSMYFVGKNVKDGWDYLGEIFSSNGNSDSSQEPVDKNEPKDTSELLRYLEETIGRNFRRLKILSIPEIQEKFLKLVGHESSAKDCQVTFKEDGEEQTFSFDPQYLQDIQEYTDLQVLNLMQKRINSDYKSRENFDSQKALASLSIWLKETYNAKDDNKDTTPNVPEYLQQFNISSDYLNDIRKFSEEEVRNNLKCTMPLENIHAQGQIFAANYAIYKILENNRQPDGQKKSINDVEPLINQGCNIFYSNLRAMRYFKGQGPDEEERSYKGPSIESLIEMSFKMVKNSSSLLEKGDHETPSPDLAKDAVKKGLETDYKDNEVYMTEFYYKLSLEDIKNTLENNMTALQAEQQELLDKKDLNDEQRENLRKRKDQLIEYYGTNSERISGVKEEKRREPIDTSAFTKEPTGREL